MQALIPQGVTANRGGYATSSGRSAAAVPAALQDLGRQQWRCAQHPRSAHNSARLQRCKAGDGDQAKQTSSDSKARTNNRPSLADMSTEARQQLIARLAQVQQGAAAGPTAADASRSSGDDVVAPEQPVAPLDSLPQSTDDRTTVVEAEVMAPDEVVPTDGIASAPPSGSQRRQAAQPAVVVNAAFSETGAAARSPADLAAGARGGGAIASANAAAPAPAAAAPADAQGGPRKGQACFM